MNRQCLTSSIYESEFSPCDDWHENISWPCELNRTSKALVQIFQIFHVSASRAAVEAFTVIILSLTVASSTSPGMIQGDVKDASQHWLYTFVTAKRRIDWLGDWLVGWLIDWLIECNIQMENCFRLGLLQ